MNIDPAEYERIEQMIRCDESPVGIDAKKTHVYIIHMLHRIDQRLSELENRANGINETVTWEQKARPFTT